MNKKLLLFFIMVLALCTAACSTSTNMGYIQEFPQLPSYHGMTLEKTNQDQNRNLPHATYEIKSITNERFIKDYSSILIKNGWDVTIDKSNTHIIARKENHQADIITQKDKKNLRIFIQSR